MISSNLTSLLTILGSFAGPLANQLFLTPPTAPNTLVTPQVFAFVKDVLDKATIPGLSMGIVRLRSQSRFPDVQLATWGRQTEDAEDDDMTSDVSEIERPPATYLRRLFMPRLYLRWPRVPRHS